MKRLRRLRNVLRPRRLLAAAGFVFCAYLFANNLSPRPRFTVQTGITVEMDEIGMHGPVHWATVEDLSDDGRQVTVGVHDGDFRSWRSRLELWDSRTGTNQTPAHWNEREFQRFLPRGWWGDRTGLTTLLSHPSGREFLHDAAAWTTLRERIVGRPAGPNRGVGPDGELEECDHFPKTIRPSPDGRFISYVTRNGRPVCLLPEHKGDGTVIEELRTGRRVAVLAGVTDRVRIAPGGRTAVSRASPKGDGDQPYLVLWDLETSSRRAELLFPHEPDEVQYSPDGRYLFATAMFTPLVRYWEAESGRAVGDLDSRYLPGLVAGGHMLVSESTGVRELQFWDAATGRELDGWAPDWPKAGTVGRLDIRDGRHVFAEFDPQIGPPARSPIPVVDKVADWLDDRLSGGPAARERTQVVILDAVERRVVGRVPGRSVAVSPNGAWLATVNADGVVRVWDLPLGRPWARGVAYAGLLWGGGWLWLRRRRRRTANGEPGA